MFDRAMLNLVVLGSVLLGIAGCTESIAPTIESPALPALRIETVTRGDSLDDDGYTILFDSIPLPRRLSANDVFVIPQVTLNTHSFTLNDVAGQCAVRGEMPRTLLAQYASSWGLDTLIVGFRIICAGRVPRVEDRIIFESDRNGDGDSDIFAMRDDGTDVVNLTNNGWRNRYPAVSPDGSKLVFFRTFETSGSAGCPNYEMGICWATGDSTYFIPYVTNVDRSGLRPLVPDGVFAVGESPRWSPDGSQIAFVTDGLIIVNSDGSGYHHVTRHPVASPEWSPDGNRLAYTDSGLSVVALGGALSTVTRRPVTSFDWSPDGTRFAFTAPTRSPADSNYRYEGLFVIKADGSGEMELAKFRHRPAWSPDGRKIASLGGGKLYVMNADGTQETMLPSDGPVTAFAWSPDGATLAIETELSGTPDIYTIRLDGSGLHNLTADPHRDVLAAWHPATVTGIGVRPQVGAVDRRRSSLNRDGGI